MALFCPQCGAATTPGSAFCGACGAALEASPLQPASVPMAPTAYAPPPAASLRPQGVTAIAVACFVIAAFAVLGALAVAFVGSVLGALFAGVSNGASAAVAGSIILVVFVFLGVFAGALIAVGIGLNRGRGWARIGAIVLAVLFGLGQVSSVVSELSGIANGRGGGVFVPILFVAGAVFVVYYLMKPDVRAWFDAQPR